LFMDEKESDFISKYIKDEGEVKKGKSSLSMFGYADKGSKEVFSVSEDLVFSEDNSRFKKKVVSSDNKDEEKVLDKPIENIESKSIIADAKREFLEEIENQALTVDTCTQVNRDWGKK
jgi:hypothetical protein